jgi:hypothetical protein
MLRIELEVLLSIYSLLRKEVEVEIFKDLANLRKRVGVWIEGTEAPPVFTWLPHGYEHRKYLILVGIIASGFFLLFACIVAA